jgi:hypothetical protein
MKGKSLPTYVSRQWIVERDSGRINFQENIWGGGIVVNRAEIFSLAVSNVVFLKRVKKEAMLARIGGGQRGSGCCAQAHKKNDNSREHGSAGFHVTNIRTCCAKTIEIIGVDACSACRN